MTWATTPRATKATIRISSGCGRCIPRPGRLSGLRTVPPGGEVRLLLRGEHVDVHAHGSELEPRDLEVDVTGNAVHLALQRGTLLDHELGGERLVGEAHVHHRGGMPFR